MHRSLFTVILGTTIQKRSPFVFHSYPASPSIQLSLPSSLTPTLPPSSAVVSHQNGLYSIPTETGSNAEYAEPDAGIAQYGAPGGDTLQYGQPGEYMERKVTLQGRQEQTNYAVPNRQATDDDDILPVPIKSGGTGTLNRSSLLVETVANASSGEYYASGVVATSEYQQLAEVVAEHGSVAYDMASGSPAYDTAA